MPGYGVRAIFLSRRCLVIGSRCPGTPPTAHRPPRTAHRFTMPKVYLETYGCKMNVADSELILGLLAREGYVTTDGPAAADLLLVNTCAVRDHAEQRVIGRLGE